MPEERLALPRRWRGNSVFGPGLRSPRDREWLVQWKARIGFLRRAGKLTALHAEIALALARRLSQDGRCDPSHATIAADAGAGCRTVQRALARLSELGMLRWIRRLIRDGSFCEQTSNSYELRLGDGQVGRGTPKKILISAPVSAPVTAMHAAKDAVKGVVTALMGEPDLLRARRQALAARWLAAAR
jgi:hypothetical protein